MGYDNIDTRKVFFVPMLAPCVTLEETESFSNLTEERFAELLADPMSLDFSGKDVKFHTNKSAHNELTHVKMRLLHHDEDLPVSFVSGKVDPHPKKRYDKVVLHFHGGGFVAMDSASHQNYTIKWANGLKVPVFSVDYRLSPKYPFPDPVNDCF